MDRQAADYMLKCWEGFTRFLDDGRICRTNNTTERALRGIAMGGCSRLFSAVPLSVRWVLVV